MITQEQELNCFITIWKQKPIEYKLQVIEEVASYHQESNHTPDYYFFDFDQDGDLCSPTSGKKIKDYMRRETYIDNIEADVVDVLDNEIKKGHTRFAWVSPPCSGVYPDLKVTISEIVECQGRKRFLNRSFLFNFDYSRSWSLAQDMAQISVNKPQINSLEDIRRLPLILDPQKDWVTYLAKAVQDPFLEWFVKTSEDQISKQQALVDASNFYEKILKQPSVELKIGNNIDFKSYGFGDYISSCPPPESYSSESWYDYNPLTQLYRCKFCCINFSKSGIKSHRCVC